MKNGKDIRHGRHRLSIASRLSLVSGLVMVAAGCGQAYQTFYSDTGPFDANYATFEHPFTDAGEADARRRAQAQCAQKKRGAVRTSRVCSLSRCTTSFQCMTEAEAAVHSPDGRGR